MDCDEQHSLQYWCRRYLPKMKVRRASPFLLLFAPSFVYTTDIKDSIHGSTLGSIHKREDTPIQGRDAQKEPLVSTEKVNEAKAPSQRPYRGTDDAPVDGLDGKPHAGPFVDTSPDKSKTLEAGANPKATPKTSREKWQAVKDERFNLEEIPDRVDGVMNDEYRVAPKPGTTGTEGGISEKEKERKAGSVTENKPQQPKEAPPLPHSEQEWIDEKAATKEKPASGGKAGDYSTYSSGGSSYSGLDKPENLPDRPAPAHADLRRADEPPIDHSSPWLKETLPYTLGQKPGEDPNAQQPHPHHIIPDSDTWHEWFHSFVLSLTMILFSEIGDKTFLVAALMAMRHNQILVFTAALSALILMTVLSAVLGHTLPALLPKRLTTFAAALLFLVFGAKMLREGLAMPKNDDSIAEEMKEVEAELEEKEHSMALQNRRRSSAAPHNLEAGRGRKSSKSQANGGEPSPPSSHSPSPSPKRRSGIAGLTNLLSLVLSPAWVQTFVMTFLGEWGDRSQIATIAMAAGQDYWWVTLGAVLGHACCTGIAVLGGRALAGRVSMRVGKLILLIHSERCFGANVFCSHDRRRRRIHRVRSHISV